MTSSRGGAVVYSKKWSKTYFLTALRSVVVFQTPLGGLLLSEKL